jgi:hypothetical protein
MNIISCPTIYFLVIFTRRQTTKISDPHTTSISKFQAIAAAMKTLCGMCTDAELLRIINMLLNIKLQFLSLHKPLKIFPSNCINSLDHISSEHVPEYPKMKIILLVVYALK